MSLQSRGWIARFVLVAGWLATTAVTAFVVARATTSADRPGDALLVAPPISADQRQTTALQPRAIQPVISGDGQVIADGGGFALEAAVTPQEQAYQLLSAPVGVKAMIVGGPAGFDCPWLGLAQGGDGAVTMRCRIPSDVRVVVGLSGTMVLAMAPPRTAPALPVSAVVGGADRGQVVVVGSDGGTSVRQVGLGMYASRQVCKYGQRVGGAAGAGPRPGPSGF